jgi:uncharacterized protein YqgC (DUF456 family)
MEIAANIGTSLLYLLIAVLCLSGLILSCLCISGTWLVSLAALLTFFLKGDSFAGWICVGFFLAVSAIIEALEFISSSLGVARKGGSKLAGFMAFIGGIIGAILGSFIPIPIVGPLLGMFLLSFLLVYAVEYNRVRKHAMAADIATGTILARAAIILLKVTATLGMTLYLWVSIIAKAL